MKFEYQKKIASLNRLKKRGASTDHLERTKATVSHLHTRYIVDMQSMDSTVSEINRLRDEQLYPKLVQLVDGMAIMWENMKYQHDNQSKIVQALRSLDISHAPTETSEHHYNNTRQLHIHVQMWHTNFEKLMKHQKEYIKSLNDWLKLNLIPIDNNLREKVSSPQRPQTPPIQILLRTWHDFLEKLPEEGARTAINNFAAVMDTIFQYQTEEMKMKESCQETRRELARKTRKFEDWYNKYMQKRVPDDMDNDKEVIADQQITVDLLKKRLEEEEEGYQRQCIQQKSNKELPLAKPFFGTAALRSLDISHAPTETSEHHYNNTRQLHIHVQMWHTNFEKLMKHQKEYIKSLNDWLKLNLIPIDNNLREKVSSPQRPQTPPIQILLRTWHDFLEKLPEEGARTAINNFAAVMDTIFQYQTEEMKMKESCQETRRELARKRRKFEDWYNKYMQKRVPDDMDNDKEVIADQQITVDLLKKRLEEEEEGYQRQCIQQKSNKELPLAKPFFGTAPSSTNTPYDPLPSSPSQQQPPQYYVILPYYSGNRPNHRRCLTYTTILLLIAAAIFLLYPSDPYLKVVKLSLKKFNVHTTPKPSLDIELGVRIKIRNPDVYSLNYESLNVSVEYRGEQLGFVTSDNGSVRAFGTSYIDATLVLDGAEVINEVVFLVVDLLKGSIPFTTTSEVKGSLGVVLFNVPISVCECVLYSYLIT
ncbi:hypothetical protein CTI12_AA190320 [Artemisia annua]|nr:hypothetical protein CTI12_AA190320 [Artemisia annua]